MSFLQTLSFALLALAGCLAFFLVACSSGGSRNSESTPIAVNIETSEGERYAVYSAILNEKYKDRFVLIADKTSPGFFGQTISADRIAGVSEATIAEYNNANKSDEPMQNAFTKDLHYLIISDAEQKRLYTVNGWQELKKKFPEAGTKYPMTGGVITFSRIGFNPERTEALVAVNYSCPALCGWGGFYFLKKRDGAWAIESESTSWVS